MKKQQIRNSFLLLLTAVIWGGAFVSQSIGMDYVQPFTFNAVRSIIGGMVLIPCIAVLNRIDKSNKESKEKYSPEEQKKQTKELFLGGTLCGIALCFASSFQQFGILYTSVGKAGFITAFYIIIVPVLGLFFKKNAVSAYGLAYFLL